MRTELKTHGFAPFSLQKLAGRLQRFNSHQRGSTLIEMMIVISIMSIVSMGLVYLLSDLMEGTALAQNAQIQGINANALSDSVSSKLNSTMVGDVGRLTASGTAINPASLAEDQIVFTDSNGDCYRISYVAPHDGSTVGGQLWETEAPSCSSIEAVRGPNEVVPGTVDSYFAADSDPNYDPMLDNLDNYEAAHVIASNVYLTPAGSTTPASGDGPFSYYDATSTWPLEVDAKANSESDNEIYDSPATLATIESVKFHVWLGTGQPAGPTTPKLQEVTETMTLNM